MASLSILANELKSDVRTIEDLKHKLENAPIKPRAICKSLDFIFGWKSFVTPCLTDPPLVNHSRYNCFIVRKEKGLVKFRAKRLPQDSEIELEPRAGLRLLKENTLFCPVDAAEFRTNEIPFDRIFKTVSIITSRLALLEKMKIQGSWDRLRDDLEAFPGRRGTLRKMILTDLPKQGRNDPPAIPDFLLDADDGNALSGHLHDESIEEGSLDEVCEDMDVCVYTDGSKGRPWVGRVKQMLPGGKFVIHWFVRKSGRGEIFTALNNANGTPSLTELELDTIMFWAMTEKRRQDSFVIAPFWMETMRLEYLKLDK